MGLNSFGKKTKNAIRAAAFGGAILSSGAAEAGPKIPPSPAVMKQMLKDDLASQEAHGQAVRDKIAADLKMINEKAKAHAESPEGQAEMEQLKKQFGVSDKK